jgi:hypothetical protein
MAGDLTMDAHLRFKGASYTEQFLMDTAASYEVFIGTPMMINQGTDTTHVEPFVDAFHATTSDVCVGIAAEHIDVVSGAAETTPIRCFTWPSIIGFDNTTSAFTLEDLGKSCYFSGSGLLSQTATDNALAGTLFAVEDGYAYVKLTTPTKNSGTG